MYFIFKLYLEGKWSFLSEFLLTYVTETILDLQYLRGDKKLYVCITSCNNLGLI